MQKISIKEHQRYLLLAHKYSLEAIGSTYPNPSVGCLIVDYTNNCKGKLVSVGITGKSGRPHAEEIALKNKWITKKNILNAALFYGKCNYSQYLLNLIKKK